MKNLFTTTLLLTMALTAMADDIKMCTSGSCVVGISATTGNMTIIKKSPQNTVEGIAVVPNTTKRNATPTVARFDAQQRLTSISGLGYTQFEYKGNKASATTTSTFGTTQFSAVEVSKTSSVSFSGLIDWADNMLMKFSGTWGNTINETLKTIDDVTDIKQFFNSSLGEQAKMNAKKSADGTILGDAIEMYDDVSSWMDWVKKGTGGGLFVGKQLLKLLANYTKYRDKWADMVYNYMITIDNRRKEEASKNLGSKIADEELKNFLAGGNNTNDDSGSGGGPDSGGSGDSDGSDGSDDGGTGGGPDSGGPGSGGSGGSGFDNGNPYPPLQTLGVINISKKNLLDRLTDEEMALIRKKFDNDDFVAAMENGCKEWMKNLDKLKAQESEECLDTLRTLTYDDLMELSCSMLEGLAISIADVGQAISRQSESKLRDMIDASLVIKGEGQRLLNAGETDESIKRKLGFYVKQLPMARAVNRYNLGKYVFF